MELSQGPCPISARDVPSHGEKRSLDDRLDGLNTGFGNWLSRLEDAGPKPLCLPIPHSEFTQLLLLNKIREVDAGTR